MRTTMILVILIAMAARAATCDAAGGTQMSGRGEWRSGSSDSIGGVWKATLVVTGKAVEGGIEMTGSNIFSGGTVTGSMDETSITLGVMTNGVEQATFSGKLNGDQVEGEWSCPAVRDRGVWKGVLRLAR